MKFRNYCIIVLGGGAEQVKDIIKNLSDTPPRFLSQNGLLVSTFTSAFTPAELREIIDEDRRTFFIFEISNDVSSSKIGREDIDNQLFGHINDDNENLLRIMTNTLIDDVNSNVKISGNTQSDSISLEEELSLAIQNEDYIRAAEIRDKIELNNTNE